MENTFPIELVKNLPAILTAIGVIVGLILNYRTHAIVKTVKDQTDGLMTAEKARTDAAVIIKDDTQAILLITEARASHAEGVNEGQAKEQEKATVPSTKGEMVNAEPVPVDVINPTAKRR